MYRYIAPVGLLALVATVLFSTPPIRYAALLPLDALAAASDSAITRVGSQYTMLAATPDGAMRFYRATFRDGPFALADGVEALRGSAPELHRIDERWLLSSVVDGDVALALGAAPVGPFHEVGRVVRGAEPTIVRNRSSGALALVYVADGIVIRQFTLDGDQFAWAGDAHRVSTSGRSPSIVATRDANWLLTTTDDGIMIAKLGADTAERATLLLGNRSPALAGAWNHPANSMLVPETDGIYSMYFHATSRDDGHSAALRVTLTFVDAKGAEIAPRIVEEAVAMSNAQAAR